MYSLRPPLITEHHSVSSLSNLAREALPSSTYLRPARDEDTTYAVGSNCSRVDGDKCTDNIETRSYSPDASVDPTEARNACVRLISLVGIAKRPQLAFPDRLLQGELVPPQHFDVVDQQG